MTNTRPCTCAPDERPYPCQHQYALGLCRKAEIRSLRAELDRCIAQIGDLAKLRSEEEITHGNVMGRIAIALFDEQNNRTDEECVTKVAEVVLERDLLRKHLHDEHQRHIGTMDERDALAALLPGVYYMDPPDGGDVPLVEQIRRMAADAARYRWLKNNAVQEKYLGDKYIEFHCDFESWNDVDAAIDAALAKDKP